MTPHKRRHHNTKGLRQIQQGKTQAEGDRLDKKYTRRKNEGNRGKDKGSCYLVANESIK
jgi:hypothetical protein